ncbi:adenosylcobinamide-phosphate synthase CbiB [Gorillibacterium sp. sgz5001074]|uniref:adenosylcobinamide-phosphate synthase CbiB n=1 Tax=Gorillibacterium sp. sgz5001074 TaxID=3446695 RepID=UPI003F664987
MLWYTPEEILGMLLAALVIDWLVGDPPWPTHPVILIGRWIKWLERRLRDGETPEWDRAKLKRRGTVLTAATVILSAAVTGGIVWALHAVHPWLGMVANAWLISTTVAVKGLKDAALLVYRPLAEGNLPDARKYVGYIVGRDTAGLNEPEITRAAVETVAENTVDAVVSPLFFALLGAAPLAMAYRASNTLDSMVGYRSERYLHFGWASARWDDVLNLLPARLTAWMLVLVAACSGSGLSAVRARRAVRQFARLHPSPNSGFPESAVAGALGVELGGRNTYGGLISERARMGWPLRPLGKDDLVLTVRLLYRVSYLIAGGCLCALMILKAL